MINIEQVQAALKVGQIGVFPTDTMYGLLGSALSSKVVERIYAVRNRSKDKPFIVLISRISDLDLFGVSLDAKLRTFLEKHWPGKISVVISGISDRWRYVHRGKGSIAFRLPDKKELRQLISEIGPLVAPSANPEGKPPATTIAEAKKYFEDQVDPVVDFGIAEQSSARKKRNAKIHYGVDFFLDGGTLNGKPSTLVKYEQGTFITLREGAVRVT